jgi:hypothetical protein
MKNKSAPGSKGNPPAPAKVDAGRVRKPIHRFQKGVSGNPRGRPKGSIDKTRALQLKALARGEHTPLDILLAIARKDAVELRKMGIDPRECNLNIRKSAAEACMPYVHRRMPVALDVELSRPGNDDMRTLFKFMSDDELRNWISVCERAEKQAAAASEAIDVVPRPPSHLNGA